MGHRMLRYGGTFSICNHWANFRGPAHLRQPYNDGVQSHGGSSRGVGVLEVQGLAEAMGMTAVLGLGICGPLPALVAEKVDFISYCLEAADGSQGQLGQLRAEDGHPEPYQITHVQIGNEEVASKLVGVFTAMAAAMEGRAAQLGHGGKLTYVLGSDMRSDAGSSM
jgi:alpha-L-arabinofuranosidase